MQKYRDTVAFAGYFSAIIGSECELSEMDLLSMQKEEVLGKKKFAQQRNKLLRTLYFNGGHGEASCDAPGSEASSLPALVESGLVRVKDGEGIHRQRFELTHSGIRVLRSEPCVCPNGDEGHDLTGCADSIFEELQIESATESCRRDAFPLCFECDSALWAAHKLKIWGRHPCVQEPILIGEADITVVEAESATCFGRKDLDSLLGNVPRMKQHLDAFHGTDGKVVQNIYELAEHLELQEAIGSNIIVLQDLRVEPSLVGGGIGTKVLGRLMARYGKGGGVLLVPLQPYGAPKGSDEHADAVARIAESMLASGLIPHPYVDGYMVGCIRKVAGLPV